jgi:phage-related protein
VRAVGGDIQNIGLAIVQGVWQGIQNAASWFNTQITGFFTNMVNNVQSSLGINSPSKVFAGIGVNTIKGFAEGAMGEFQAMQAEINTAFGGLAFMPSLSSGSGLRSTNQNDSFQFFAPVIIQGHTPSGSLGATLKGKRF